MYLLPGFTRRGVLFAVPVPPNFRESDLGRRSITNFHLLVAITTLIGVCAMLFSPESFMGAIATAGPVLILLAGGAGFAWQYRRLAPYAVDPSRRVVDASVTTERMPWFAWLSAGPFAFIVAAALFLRANWARIPARFPIHWTIHNEPNRWSEKNFFGVYGPLFFAGGMCLYLVVLALAMWFGARRSRLRRVIMGCLIGAEYLLGVVFTTLAVNPVVQIPILIPILIPLFFFIPLLVVLARQVEEVDATPEATSNARWIAGFIYYNPDDPALMVEKRFGIGYTFNFANPWSWALMGGLVPLIGSGLFLL